MQVENAFGKNVVRTDATAKLLLLTARYHLSVAKAETARKLASEVSDWDSFIDIATRKFSIVLSYRALLEHAADIVPPEKMDRMKELSKRVSMMTLRIAAAQLDFHKKCIVSTQARHAYLKGIALCLQHGRNYSDRFCRDVDVLVENDMLENVVSAAVDAGYRIILTLTPFRLAESATDRKFVSKFASVVMLLGPDNTLFEVHRRLDKGSLNFDLSQALNTTEKVELSGVQMDTLAKPYHFVYSCYHHSRHFWSRLHWIADLDSMIENMSDEKTQILRFADTVGIAPTIEAAFEFHELISSPEEWSKALKEQSLASEFLRACLINLEGGLQLEYSLRKNKFLDDFISVSQITPERYYAVGKNPWLNKFNPNVAQYAKRPYPEKLFWLYRIEMVLIHARDTVANLLGFNAKSSSKRGPEA